MVIGVEGMARSAGWCRCDTLLRPTVALRHGVGPANANVAFFRRLPAVAPPRIQWLALRSATRPIP